MPVVEEVKYQVDTPIIPTFPSEVLYVLSREYESLWDSTKGKYTLPEAEYIRENQVSIKKYMEHRLMTLFPNLAYVGLVDKIENKAISLVPEKSKRPLSIKSQDGYYMPSFAEKVSLEKMSDADESKYLWLSHSERRIFDKLNSLADTAAFITVERIRDIQVNDSIWNVNKKLSEDSVPYYMRESMLISLLTSGMGSHLFFRVMQSKARATYVSEFFYPEQTKDGRIGDAYKHLYVNTMLRNYVGTALAWLIMDIYWENAASNAPCDMVMDLHNNHVGRSSRYRDLRGSEHSKWIDWAHNVKSFVEDTTRNATYQNWNKEIPLLVVKEEESKANERLYLYWNKSELESEEEKVEETENIE
ncbi:MAG: hypothetical protein UF228_03125 [Lachnospiraceae bacterium]|nr:hypothetical protein [Lachnospiraceae bacterium]